MKTRHTTKIQFKSIYYLGAAALGFLGLTVFALTSITGIFSNPEKAIAGPWDDYNYGKYIEVNASMVSGTASLIDFPVLLSFTDPDLRTAANGGALQNANGYDIIFTTGDCSSALDFEIESYNATTGALIAWVRIPSLSPDENTGFHMYYGNAAITVDPSTSDVWAAYDIGVFHLDGNVNDFSGRGNSGTNFGASAVNGMIGRAYNYNGSADYATTGSSELITANEFSVSCWFKADVTNFAHHIWWQGQNSGNGWGNTHQEMHLTIGDWTTSFNPDVIHFFMGDIGIDISNDVIHTRYPFTDTGGWHYAVVNVKNLNTKPYAELYLDGAFLHSDTGTTAKTSRSLWTNNFRIARPHPSTRLFDGMVDELRISSTTKDSDWINTVYSMVTEPASFVSRSAQMTGVDLCRTLPIDLIEFSARENNSDISVYWKTATELNTDYFEVAGSADGLEWAIVGRLPAAGTSNTILNYSLIDESPLPGRNYYQLKEVDKNGSVTYFGPVSILFRGVPAEVKTYPNPVQEQLYIDISNSSFSEFRVVGVDGKLLHERALDPNIKEQAFHFDFANFPAGVYILEFKGATEQLQKKIIKRDI